MSTQALRDLGEEGFEAGLSGVIENKHGAATWGDDEMESALRAIYDGDTLEDALDGTDLSDSQVDRQAERAVEYAEESGATEPSDTDSTSDSEGPGRFEDNGEAPDGTPPADDSTPTDGDVWQSPGEVAAESFASWLNEMTDYVGIKENFINRMEYEVKNQGQLPSPQRLGNMLDAGKSGVGNSEQIRWTVQQYTSWLGKYRREASPHLSNALPQNTQGPQSQQSGFGGQQGGWGQSSGWGAQSPQTGGQQGGWGQPAQGPAGGQNPEMQMMRQMMQQQQEFMEKMMSERDGDTDSSSDNSSQSESALDTLKEFKEMQSTLKELQGGDNSSEMEDAFAMMQQQIQQLQQEIQSSGQADADDPIDRILLQTAQRDDVSVDDIQSLAEKFGRDTDPSVLEKKYEKEMKEQELEHKKNRTESMMSTVEELGTTIAGEISKAIADRGEGQNAQGSAQPQGQPNANAQSRQPAQGQQTETPPAAGDGGTQPAGSNTAPDPQDFGTDDGMFECPYCGESTPIDANTPGMECYNCDYSVQPCPYDGCGNPVEILPPGEVEGRLCPECDGIAYPTDDGDFACENCDWEGPESATVMEAVECSECGMVHQVARPNAPEYQAPSPSPEPDADAAPATDPNPDHVAEAEMTVEDALDMDLPDSDSEPDFDTDDIDADNDSRSQDADADAGGE